jgi:hypothetical protein
MSKLKLHEVCYFTAENSKHKVRNLLDSSGKWTSPGKDFNSIHLIHNFRKAFNDKRRRQERISIRKLLVQFMRLCWGRISASTVGTLYNKLHKFGQPLGYSHNIIIDCKKTR